MTIPPATNRQTAHLTLEDRCPMIHQILIAEIPKIRYTHHDRTLIIYELHANIDIINPIAECNKIITVELMDIRTLAIARYMYTCHIHDFLQFLIYPAVVLLSRRIVIFCYA